LENMALSAMFSNYDMLASRVQSGTSSGRLLGRSRDIAPFREAGF
jgi:hypothetical protein